MKRALPFIWALSLLLIFTSALYLTHIFTTTGNLHPVATLEQIIVDLEHLGYYAFILDALVLSLIGFWTYRYRQKNKKL